MVHIFAGGHRHDMFYPTYKNSTNSSYKTKKLKLNKTYMCWSVKSFQKIPFFYLCLQDGHEDIELIFECTSCHHVMPEENMSYSDNTCPHCGSTMYRNGFNGKIGHYY